MTFEEALAAWLPTQRWFAGKGSPVTGVAIASDTTLAKGDPGLRHLVLTVSQGTHRDTYQVFAGFRAKVPQRLRHAVIGPGGHGMTAYDGLHDAALTRLLLAAMAAGQTAGPLRFGHEPGAELDTSLESLVLTGEQSNTSLVFGEAAILKVFRRPSPGPHAELEVPRALARLRSPHVAPPLGWVEGDLAGAAAVFGILSTYLRTAVDGWSLAATSVRDLYGTDEEAPASEAGGDFAGEAARLGEATAEVHRDLAAAFGTRELTRTDLAGVATGMQDRLTQALAAVPQLAPHEDMLRHVFAEVATLDGPLPVQRTHGDYHLGQVMRTQTGWVVLDFEGEPAADPAERRAWYPALRDVAGMLRSFDYAARHQLPDDGSEHLQRAARDWARRNQAAFRTGYARAGGADPNKHAVLLQALTLDKAVYEVRYEARHRPSWLFIPLGSIADAEVDCARPSR